MIDSSIKAGFDANVALLCNSCTIYHTLQQVMTFPRSCIAHPTIIRHPVDFLNYLDQYFYDINTRCPSGGSFILKEYCIFDGLILLQVHKPLSS